MIAFKERHSAFNSFRSVSTSFIENSEENGNERAQLVIAQKVSRDDLLEIVDDQVYTSYVCSATNTNT